MTADPRPPGTALERAAIPAGALPAELTFDEMLKRATVFAKSELVPRALQGKPESIVLVGVLGAEYGLSFMAALRQIDVIEGRPSPSAALRGALVRHAGHEIRTIRSTGTVAVIEGRRRGSKDWARVEFTIDDARRAGLVDRWVERWVSTESGRKRPEKCVVGDDRGIYDKDRRHELGLPFDLPDWAAKQLEKGEVKAKDNWQHYPGRMLHARATTQLVTQEFPDVLAGFAPVDDDIDVPDAAFGIEPADEALDDDGIVDAEIVDEDREERAEDVPTTPANIDAETGEILADDVKEDGVDPIETVASPAPAYVPPTVEPVVEAAHPSAWDSEDFYAYVTERGAKAADVIKAARKFAASHDDVEVPRSIGEFAGHPLAAEFAQIIDRLGT